jgi:hypothetical protein
MEVTKWLKPSVSVSRYTVTARMPAKYRIVHFATHGALAGQLGGNSEAGLILTPPNSATEIGGQPRLRWILGIGILIRDLHHG